MKPQPFLSRSTTLQLTLGISVALHAALLSVRFIDPEGFNRVFQDTPLEVILVNAKSSERPDKAQAIAQANMAGGGEADKGRATSPMPYSALTALGDDYEESQRRLDALQEQQNQLLAELRKQIAALPAPDPRKPSQSGSQAAEEENRLRRGDLRARWGLRAMRPSRPSPRRNWRRGCRAAPKVRSWWPSVRKRCA